MLCELCFLVFCAIVQCADAGVTQIVHKVKGPTAVSLKPDRGLVEVTGIGSLIVCDVTTAYVVADKTLLYAISALRH